MLKFSGIFEFSRENSYFERIRMVRMVRMVRSLADRTFQLWRRRRARRHADLEQARREREIRAVPGRGRRAGRRPDAGVQRAADLRSEVNNFEK